MKKKINSQFGRVKLLLVMLLVASLFSDFAKPEYIKPSTSQTEFVSVAAKKGTVNGRVTTEDGKPLPQASVVIRGTTVGTFTDANGNFTLKNVPSDAELQISYVGLKTAKLQPDFNHSRIVKLAVSTQAVQTVVVHPAPEIEPLSVTDDEFGIRIKGIIDNNPPLFVLDGKEISRSDFSKLSVDNIGAISVLKDDSSIEKYGEMGKNGVIVITSKKSVPAISAFSLNDLKLPGDEGRKQKKPAFVIVEQMPQFPGGEIRMMYYLSEYTKYPPQAKADKIEGTVVVNFLVSKTGKVENAKVVTSVHPALDAEAVRVVSSMPYWTPGKQNGIPVDVNYTIPIEFRLQDSDKGTSDAGVSEMENLQEQLASLQEQMSDNQNNMADLQKLAASDQKLNFEHSKQLTGLQTQMGELGKQMSDDQKQMETLQKSMTASRDQNADYQKQIASFQSQLGDRQKQMSDLQSQLKELQAQVAPVQYRQIEKMQQFPGGETEMMKFIRLNLKYPATAQVNGISGSALVLFIVDKNGKIANAVVTNEIDPSLRAEALRVIKSMPDWIPGKQGGRVVNVACTIPIRFVLSGSPQSDYERSFLKGDFPEVVKVGSSNPKSVNKDYSNGESQEKEKHLYYDSPPVRIPISEEEQPEEKPYVVVEQMPKFPGGDKAMMEFINKSLKYPGWARRNELEGTVIVNFVVDKEGKIKNPRVMKSPDESFSEEAIRIIRLMPDWTPGKQGSKAVPVSYTIPVRFVLRVNKDQPYYFGPSQKEVEPPYVIVEQMPKFPGGDKAMMEFINRNLKYPGWAKRNKIQGTVIVNFVIDKEGKIKNPKVMKSPSEAFSKEALRILSLMPDWTPGKQGGKAVPVSYTIPIKFTLPTESGNSNPVLTIL